mmetsp:Transcript_1640/g.5587  ORF Transcript_1640/g.5587 Transcript_1640/m.5587 type:complete len:206 (-) Transcript_1640:1170-1787(-)
MKGLSFVSRAMVCGWYLWMYWKRSSIESSVVPSMPLAKSDSDLPYSDSEFSSPSLSSWLLLTSLSDMRSSYPVSVVSKWPAFPPIVSPGTSASSVASIVSSLSSSESSSDKITSSSCGRFSTTLLSFRLIVLASTGDESGKSPARGPKDQTFCALGTVAQLLRSRSRPLPLSGTALNLNEFRKLEGMENNPILGNQEKEKDSRGE